MTAARFVSPPENGGFIAPVSTSTGDDHGPLEQGGAGLRAADDGQRGEGKEEQQAHGPTGPDLGG